MAIRVGDKVRVIVDEPIHDWGAVTPDSVGVVVSIVLNLVKVDFPEQKDWSAELEELELVNTPYTAKDIRNRPVYKQLKASAADAKTLTKLVKYYLYNINNLEYIGFDFENKTERVLFSFNWRSGYGGVVLWTRVHKGQQVTFDQIPNPPKADKVKAEPVEEQPVARARPIIRGDVPAQLAAPEPAPVRDELPPAPPAPQAVVGDGERPVDATHWHPGLWLWLKVDGGVVSFYYKGLGWHIYGDQRAGFRRLETAIKLEDATVPKIKKPVKMIAPKRIGWWGDHGY